VLFFSEYFVRFFGSSMIHSAPLFSSPSFFRQTQASCTSKHHIKFFFIIWNISWNRLPLFKICNPCTGYSFPGDDSRFGTTTAFFTILWSNLHCKTCRCRPTFLFIMHLLLSSYYKVEGEPVKANQEMIVRMTWMDESWREKVHIFSTFYFRCYFQSVCVF